VVSVPLADGAGVLLGLTAGSAVVLGARRRLLQRALRHCLAAARGDVFRPSGWGSVTLILLNTVFFLVFFQTPSSASARYRGCSSSESARSCGSRWHLIVQV
jgi:hypothetical protein